MNLKGTAKKLQNALLSVGLIIKIESSQFYSSDQERMVTVWIISTPTLQNGKNGWKIRDYEILRTASTIEMVKCLADIWEQVKEWNL
jgi:hypothetical protein